MVFFHPFFLPAPSQKAHDIGGSPKIRDTFLGVPIMDFYILGSILGPFLLGNYHIVSPSARGHSQHQVQRH